MSGDGSTTDCAQTFLTCAKAVVNGAVPQCDGGTSSGDASVGFDSGPGATTTVACKQSNICSEQKQYPQAGVSSYATACMSASGVAVTDGTGCPTSGGLSGCCLQKGGTSEICYYNTTGSTLTQDQTSCTSSGGTWSAGLQ